MKSNRPVAEVVSILSFNEISRIPFLEDNNELLGFGIKDTVPGAKTLIIHFKMPHGHVFIYASENAPSVYVSQSLILDTNNDPTEDCVNAILASIKSTGKEVS